MRRFLIASCVALVCASAAADPPKGPSERQQVVEALAKVLADDYVDPKIGAQYAAKLRADAKATNYEGQPDFEFANTVVRSLQAVHPDNHLRMRAPDPAPGQPGPRVVQGPGPGGDAKAIEAAERLTPKIAYIRFNLFPGDPDTMAQLEKFIADNAGVETLIIDARGHRGGEVGEIDALFSDLFTRPVDLVQMEIAKAITKDHPDMLGDGPTMRRVSAPANLVRMQHFVKPNAKPRLANTRLYVLQSRFTGSAAEHLVFEVKMSGRGKLVGETTNGANHFGFPFELPAGYSVFVPAGRTFDPKTGKDWEGTGVAPDISAPADRALVTALTDAGVGATEAEAINTRINYTPPKPRPPGAGPVIVKGPDAPAGPPPG
ncbi:MAG TPA: S41 family peptidase [Hyphomonadaceae bacterium]|nr:S41 family peptidase [Hyphomonadaceae bacterium]